MDKLLSREFPKEHFEDKKESAPRPKQVKNKNLLSFANDDDEEEGLSTSVVSFQQASGIISKTDLVTEQPVKKKEENEWVRKMKAKLTKKAEEAEVLPPKETKKEGYEEKKETKVLSTEELVKEKVKEKIREMKKKSKDVYDRFVLEI